MPHERTVVATLGTLVEAAEREHIVSPALIVVGHIVAMREKLRGRGMTARAIIIGAPRSGSGKTSVTIGLLRALARRGLAGARREIGTGLYRPRLSCRRHRPARRQSRQLGDAARPARRAGRRGGRRTPTSSSSKAPWACSTAFRPARAAPARPPISRGSTACRCCWCSTCRASRRRRRPSPRALPATTRRCASPAWCSTGWAASATASWPARPSRRSACRSSAAILRDPTLSLPERHLGLVQAGEHADLQTHLDRLADMVEASLDIDAILALATPLEPPRADFDNALPPPGQRIALAADAAFTFLYPHHRADLARRRRRDRALLAACRRGAAAGLRRLLAARRLPGTACRRNSRRRRTFAPA